MRMRTYLMVLFLIPALAHAGPYVFQMVPGSPGWSDLTIAERKAAMQIPEDTLAVMTTEDLYLTYLAHPMTVEIGMSSSGYQQGFDWIRQDYNAVSALMERLDVIEVVMDHYCALVIDETNYDNLDYQQDIDLTQMLLYQYELINSMSNDEKRKIIEKALSIYDVKHSLPNLYFWFSDQGPILMGRILFVKKYPPLMDAITTDPNIQTVLDRGSVYSPILLDFTRNYLVSANLSEDNTPIDLDLQPAFPNPFNPSTIISYVLTSAGQARLTIYSITGQKVATLVDDVQEAGSHSVVFDGKGLSSGVYLYRLETAGAVKTGRMMMVK